MQFISLEQLSVCEAYMDIEVIQIDSNIEYRKRKKCDAYYLCGHRAVDSYKSSNGKRLIFVNQDILIKDSDIKKYSLEPNPNYSKRPGEKFNLKGRMTPDEIITMLKNASLRNASVEVDNMDISFDLSRMKTVLDEYKRRFKEDLWPNEDYKWQAIKIFEDNWDINATNIADMLEKALAGTDNLLTSRNRYPKGMIIEYARLFPDEVRDMFRNLYDENLSVYDRIIAFKVKSDELLPRWQVANNKPDGRMHYQDMNAIFTYLWLFYPDKYYIYKYTVVKSAIEVLGSSYVFKKGTYEEKVELFLKFYDEIRAELQKDSELIEILKDCLRPDCYPDPELNTLTVDFGYFIANYYTKRENKPNETDEEEEDNMKGNETSVSLNTILYGPPGTGKTYNTVIYAVSIIEDKSVEAVKAEAVVDYQSVKSRYDEYSKAGRIAFTTFHQSYGYEDFIEGIKPVMTDGEDDVGYRIEPGVFKAFCERASIPSDKETNDYGLKKDPSVWKVSLGGTHENPVREDCLNNGHIRIGWDEYGPDISDKMDELASGKRVLSAFYNVMSIGDIVLSCYTSTEIDAVGIITGDAEWDDSYSRYKRVRKVKWLVKNIRENIVDLNKGYQMTLATVYWMSIPVRDILSIVEKYTVNESKKQTYNEDKHVFIIDEINRGNISKIFGELITLIEDTKRIGEDEQMEVELPYSHSSFGVPSNVYILGTMNTADRSIAIMDTALRRRFSFVEMLPESNILRSIGADIIESDGATLSVANMLDVINERIMFLFDREHTIGHAFFTSLKDNPSVENLGRIFEKSIIPLLQEYFYEDYSKIQLVLGDDGKTGDNKQYQFIRDEEVVPQKLFSSNVEMESITKYTIQYSAFDKIQSYKLISKNL